MASYIYCILHLLFVLHLCSCIVQSQAHWSMDLVPGSKTVSIQAPVNGQSLHIYSGITIIFKAPIFINFFGTAAVRIQMSMFICLNFTYILWNHDYFWGTNFHKFHWNSCSMNSNVNIHVYMLQVIVMCAHSGIHNLEYC